MASTQAGFGSGGNFPQFQLYSGSPSVPSDPYSFQQPQTVNLSGKIAPAADAVPPSKATAASALLNSVTAAVDAGYQSARNVVFSGPGQQGADSNASTSGSFSLFSLSYQQIVNFAICIGLGIFFFFLAFLFLPMVVFAPQKFVLLFTLGQMCWIAGLAMLQGPKSLMSALLKRERVTFTLIYLGSSLATFYVTLIAHSYLLTIAFCAVQIVSLVIFLISYFPGGPRMLSMVKDLVFDKVKGALGMNSGSTILPL
eukprot:Blabericola_migrator_1__10750@NODE_615_length_7273_cov_113_689564_g448_i0_p3_GENE_NODE_615_length_7273_cov_113_689564_g448_i0NODE_615_length_7273_cov_113_689564_g448_i0_p3_ORF_typecomplete_len255_score25_55Got1/PF04178_12/6_6e26PDR_CDR/PF06422_12/0_031PDR_CDR/PF06422_12/1_4e03_NODE_615_length_7273_cov_113_689564_g448_i064617225